MRLDRRFARLVQAVGPISADGPFASAAVPEDLDALFELERKAIGQVKVPRSLDRPHRGLRDLLAKESRHRDLHGARSWVAPLFDNPLAQRQLRLLNAIFFALSKRGHDGDVSADNRQLRALASVGETGVAVELGVLGKRQIIQRQERAALKGDLPASTPLTIAIASARGSAAYSTWSDDEAGRLETKVASIAAGIIVAGEARFRERLREAESWEQQRRQRIEQLRAEEIEKHRLERLANLFESGELLRRATEIRELVSRVRAALEPDRSLDQRELAAWEAWALSEADRIDPVRSGQFMSHFRPRSLEDD